MRKTRVLVAHVVVVFDDVQADDLVTASKQALCGMKADESGAAGDEDFHGIYKLQPMREEDNTCRSSADLRSASTPPSTSRASQSPGAASRYAACGTASTRPRRSVNDVRDRKRAVSGQSGDVRVSFGG